MFPSNQLTHLYVQYTYSMKRNNPLEQPRVKCLTQDYNSNQWWSWITANLTEPDFGIKLSDQNGLWLDRPAGFWTTILWLEAQMFTEIFRWIRSSLFVQSFSISSPAQLDFYFLTNKLHGLNSYREVTNVSMSECLRKSIYV